jgi:PST family polysaccharide transporter
MTEKPDSFARFSQPVTGGDGLRRKSVRGAFFMATGGTAEFALRLVVTVILARLLVPEDFGLVAMVLVLTSLAELVKDLGLGTATVQRENIEHEQISSLFWINVLFGAFLALCFCMLAPVISWFYADGRVALIAVVMATTLLWGGMGVQHEALLNRQLKQGPLSFIRLTATLISSGIAIALAVSGWGYWSLVAREVGRSFFYMGGVWWYCRWLPAFALRLGRVREFLTFGKDLTLTNILVAIIGKIDGIIVGKFFGAVALGSYRQAQNLVMAPVEQFNAPVFSVAQPGLSALQSDAERYRRYYQRVVGFVALMTMPLGAFVAVYAHEITLILLGGKWLPAVPFVAVFAVAITLRPTIATSAVVLVTLGRARVLLALALVHALVFSVLMIVGLFWGAIGVALAHVATTILLIPPKLYYSFKGSPVAIRSFLSTVWLAVLASSVMAASLIFFRTTFAGGDVANLLAGIGVGAVTYIIPWLVIPSGRAQLKTIQRDIRGSLLTKRVSGETSSN